ncbi:hypothetical protein [Streptomyces sp. NPDC007172]|uniref:hypothetical protein n=1 Tax=Streptomyces sp. NPDC007172 TaxID=3364776 RepID=UPI0036C6F9A4
MTYLVIDGARVVSAHRTLASARWGETQGLGLSTEPGPPVDGVPAWWARTPQGSGVAEPGILRTAATELGFRFELRACQAPADSCTHQPCTTYATWAVSSHYELLSELAAFVPLSWIWVGQRGDDPRGDDPQFLTEGQALVDRLRADTRQPLRAVEKPPDDVRTLEERAQAAHALVVTFLARYFGPDAETGDVVVRPVLHGLELHLRLDPSIPANLAVCGTALSEGCRDAAGCELGARICDRCFGRAPIVPPLVLGAAEYEAWARYIHRSGS